MILASKNQSQGAKYNLARTSRERAEGIVAIPGGNRGIRNQQMFEDEYLDLILWKWWLLQNL